MRKIFLTFLVLSLFSEISSSQSIYLRLINCSNENKSRKIKATRVTQFNIQYQSNIDTARHKRFLTYISGELIGISKDSITVKAFDESIVVDYKDSSDYLIDTINICKKDICRIGYIKLGGNPYLTIGVLGLISAFIVAPAISIDFNHGDFDEDKYFRVSGISTLASVVNFTLIAITTKKFWIINDKKPKRKLWKIE